MKYTHYTFVLQSDQDERSPLLTSYINSFRATRLIGANDSSIGNFYSPIDSAHNSDIEEDQVNKKDIIYIPTDRSLRRCEKFSLIHCAWDI